MGAVLCDMCVTGGRTPRLSGEPVCPWGFGLLSWGPESDGEVILELLRAEQDMSPRLALGVGFPSVPHPNPTPYLALLGCPHAEPTVGAEERPGGHGQGRKESQAWGQEEWEMRALGSSMGGWGLEPELGVGQPLWESLGWWVGGQGTGEEGPVRG